MAADGRCFVHQVNLETGSAKIKRGLNAANPPTDNHNISKITVYETLRNLFYNWFFFHHSSSPSSGFIARTVFEF
jgi:hypothetical protein